MNAKNQVHLSGNSNPKFLEAFYLLLWINKTTAEGDCSARLKVRLPNTVIFKYGSPTSWYFNNKEGEVLRKKEANLTFSHILAAFKKKKSHSIAAGTVYSYDSKEDTVVNYLTWSQLEVICGEVESPLRKEYIHPQFCVLQEFVHDGSTHNCRPFLS